MFVDDNTILNFDNVEHDGITIAVNEQLLDPRTPVMVARSAVTASPGEEKGTARSPISSLSPSLKGSRKRSSTPDAGRRSPPPRSGSRPGSASRSTRVLPVSPTEAPPVQQTPIAQPSPSFSHLQSRNDDPTNPEVLKERIDNLESLIQPLLLKVEELVVSKLIILEESMNKHKVETNAMSEALTQMSLKLSKTEDRQLVLAEAQVDLRITLDEMSQSARRLL